MRPRRRINRWPWREPDDGSTGTASVLDALEGDEYNNRREGDLVGLPLVPRGRWPHPPSQFKLHRIVLEDGNRLATVRARSNNVELTFHMRLDEKAWHFMIGDVTFMDVDSGERR